MRTSNRCCAVMAALSVVIVGCLWPKSCCAALVVDLPEVTVYADGINPVAGSFEVFLTLTGNDLTTPPNLSSFNLEFSVASSDVAFDDAIAPTSTPLFTDGMLINFSTNDQTIEAAHDIFSESPSSVAAFHGAALIKVPFTIAAGKFGTFALNVGGLNEFTDSSANSLPVSLFGGSITVAAIPEAGAWKFFGLISLLIAMIVGVRRKISLSSP